MKNIVIVDIDGTISKVGGRIKYLKQDPKDWDSFYNDCFEDEPIEEILLLVYRLWGKYEIVFCTGRREKCRFKTVRWLKKHVSNNFSKIKLLMRKDGDLRSDVEVKPELLREAGIKLEDIAFVIEDRSCMVKKYREMGLTVLQCAEGDF